MRSICDLFVFKAPFEKKETYEDKIKKISEMIEDYNINSWLNLNKTVISNESYNIQNYINETLGIKIQISNKKFFESNDYFPVLIINYFLDTEKFEKTNIEFYINDNIKLISNVFFNDFFIDFDNKYLINDINKWKKLDLKNLKEFDMNNIESKQNKNLLDSMMYIYFSLVKNIFDIDNSALEINNLMKDKIFEEFRANTLLFNKIWFETKKNLIDSAAKIKQQIDTFLKLIF